MNFEINPQLPYYLLLFILTIILRCIRTYRGRLSFPDTPEGKKDYKWSYSFFGFELVNVSAGIFILLSEHATKYVGAIMILYVILVILSFFFEESGVGRKLKTIGHMSVSVVVVLVTFYAFFAVDGLKPSPTKAATENKIQPTVWRVALTYVDTSLNRNFGVKSTPLQSSYVTEVSGPNRYEAIRVAKAQFYSETGPLPFVDKAEKNPVSMIILENSIVVEKNSPIDTAWDSLYSTENVNSQ